MNDDKIIKGVFKGLGQLGMETAEKLVEESGKILKSVITAQDLLGDIKPLSGQELAIKKQQEEVKKQQEIKTLKGQMGQESSNEVDKAGQKQENKVPGRNVAEEMTQLRHQKEKEEEEKEQYFEEQKQKKEKEQQQAEEYNSLNMESSNPAKQKKNRGSAFAKKKKQKPDESEMSATAEFKGNKVQ